MRHRAYSTSSLLILAMAGCQGSPTGPDSPLDGGPTPDTASVVENRGRVVGYTPLGRSFDVELQTWTFLGNERDIAYASMSPTRPVSVFVTDVEAEGTVDGAPPRSTEIFTASAMIQNVTYAPVEDRIYVGQFDEIVSMDRDGANLSLDVTNSNGRVAVSPDGRYLAHTRSSDGAPVLLDRQQNTVRSAPSATRVRLRDDHALYVTDDRVPAVWDLESDEILTVSGAPDFPSIVDIGGSRAQPRVTYLADDRVLSFQGDAASGTGSVTEFLHIPAGIHAIANGIDEAAASPDGARVVVSVIRDGSRSRGPCRGLFRKLWEIVVTDVESPSARVVARGLSCERPIGLAVSPGGSRLLYTVDGTLYSVDLDEG